MASRWLVVVMVVAACGGGNSASSDGGGDGGSGSNVDDGGTPIADANDPVEVGHVCRSYDSCLVCTVHAHDATTGEELARFRTA